MLVSSLLSTFFLGGLLTWRVPCAEGVKKIMKLSLKASKGVYQSNAVGADKTHLFVSSLLCCGSLFLNIPMTEK